jgi:hypothetical protein
MGVSLPNTPLIRIFILFCLADEPMSRHLRAHPWRSDQQDVDARLRYRAAVPDTPNFRLRFALETQIRASSLVFSPARGSVRRCSAWLGVVRLARKDHAKFAAQPVLRAR